MIGEYTVLKKTDRRSSHVLSRPLTATCKEMLAGLAGRNVGDHFLKESRPAVDQGLARSTNG